MAARRSLLFLLAWLTILTPLTNAESYRAKSAAEFDAAKKKLRPGDELILAAAQWHDADLRFDAHGTKEQPITLRAESPGDTVFTGSSRLHIGGSHLVVAGLWFRDPTTAKGDVIEFRRDSKQLAHHCRLTQCAISADKPVDASEEGKWLSLYGSQHRVDHCYFAGKTSGGATVVVWLGGDPEGGHVLESNHFGPRVRLGKNGGETIRIGDSQTAHRSARCVVSDNLFERCNGETEIISNKSCDNVFSRNAFVECEGTLTLRHGHRALVEGNWFLGNRRKLTGGVRIIGEDHRITNNYFGGLAGEEFRCAITLMNGIPDTPANGYQQVQRALIAFNTIADCRHPFMIVVAYTSHATLPPVDCVVVANVVYGPQSQLAEASADSSGLRWSANRAQVASLGIDTRDGVDASPFLMSAGNDQIWRSNRPLPMLGTLPSDVSPPQFDVDGQPRARSPQAGCDEFSDAPIRYRPPSAESTGPDWRRP